MSKNLLLASTIGTILGGALATAMPLEGAILFGLNGLILVKEIKTLMMPLRGLFRNLGLYNKDETYPDLRETRNNDGSKIYRFAIPPGMSFKQFEDKKDAIQDFMGKKISLKCHSKNVIMEVFEKEIESVDYEPPGCIFGLSLPFGIKRNLKQINLDLSIEPNVLLASQTGGGKSTILRIWITTLILCVECRLHLVDLKNGTELGIFERSEKVATFAKTIEETLFVLKTVKAEIERRYELFYTLGVTNFNEYNKISKEKLKYELLIFDEFAELKESDYAKECKGIVNSILAKCRAAGIRTIISTQHPEASVIGGLSKSNIPVVVGLKVKKELYSRMIIDEKGLEELRGRGHGMLQYGGDLTEFQAYNLTVDEAKRLIKDTLIEKPKQITQAAEQTDFSFMESD